MRLVARPAFVLMASYVMAVSVAAAEYRALGPSGSGNAGPLAFSPDGEWFAAVLSGSSAVGPRIDLWHVATRRKEATFRCPAGKSPSCVCFAADSRALAAGTTTGTGGIWMWRWRGRDWMERGEGCPVVEPADSGERGGERSGRGHRQARVKLGGSLSAPTEGLSHGPTETKSMSLGPTLRKKRPFWRQAVVPTASLFPATGPCWCSLILGRPGGNEALKFSSGIRALWLNATCFLWSRLAHHRSHSPLTASLRRWLLSPSRSHP